LKIQSRQSRARVCARARARRRIKSGANWISIPRGGCAAQAGGISLANPPRRLHPIFPRYLSLSLSLSFKAAADFFKVKPSWLRDHRERTDSAKLDVFCLSRVLLVCCCAHARDTFRQIWILSIAPSETDSSGSERRVLLPACRRARRFRRPFRFSRR